MNTKTLYLCLFLILIIHTGCKHNRDEFSGKTVLKIGSATISEYELLKNMKEAEKSGIKSQKEKQNWLNQFIDRTYLLQDALYLGYDTLQSVRNRVNSMAKIILTQFSGRYWEKRSGTETEVSKKEIREAFLKREYIYYVDYLYFKDRDEMERLLNNVAPVDYTQFKQAALKLKRDKNYFANQAFQWPFNQLTEANETVFTMKVGEVSNPLETSFGIFIVTINRIEKTGIKDFKSEQKSIAEMLKANKNQIVINKKINEILKLADPWFNEAKFPQVILSILISIIRKIPYLSSKREIVLKK